MGWFEKWKKRRAFRKAPSRISPIDRMATTMARYSGSCLSQSEMARESWDKADDAYYNQRKNSPRF